MKEIKAVGGETILVDDEYYDELCKIKWHASANKSSIRAKAGRGILMHRMILGLKKGDGIRVVHKNGNNLDNRKVNLLVGTVACNQWNRKIQKSNTSGFKGVSYDKLKKKFRAQIRSNKKTIYLGLFITAEEAHAAYCKAADELRGEFARYG